MLPRDIFQEIVHICCSFFLRKVPDKGVHYSIHDSIQKCNVNYHQDLYSNIVISGGPSKLPILKERIKKEIQNLVPSGYKVSRRIYEIYCHLFFKLTQDLNEKEIKFFSLFLFVFHI